MKIEYGLVGEKLGHSYSVPIHNLLGDYRYELIERSRAGVVALFASKDFRGLNVTIPYKTLAFALCDEVDEAARLVGSVNTVVNANGRLIGYNTDVHGFMALLDWARIGVSGRKVAVLGSGGTSLTVQAACHLLGAAEVVVVSRSGEVNYQTLTRDHRDVQVIVNTTPVGMYPNVGEAPVDLAYFARLEGVVDAIYNPMRTEMILQAEARGIRCASGLYMLVAQAKQASERFTGREIANSEVNRIYRAMNFAMRNIVLVGMPGSGKTTLGRALAEELGREFVDCDHLIASEAGMTIPEIFASRGEVGFRQLETEVLRKVAARSKLVIATGGGAVTRPENVRLMRQNGVVAHVQRPIEALATAGRPLSKSTEALKEMWALRAPHYAQSADCAVHNDGQIARVAQELIETIKATE